MLNETIKFSSNRYVPDSREHLQVTAYIQAALENLCVFVDSPEGLDEAVNAIVAGHNLIPDTVGEAMKEQIKQWRNHSKFQDVNWNLFPEGYRQR